MLNQAGGIPASSPTSLTGRGPRIAAKAMDAALAPLSDRYDLILFDCPPGDAAPGDLGLAMARALVIPVKFDAASLDGLELMARRVRSIRTRAINPELSVLGVALFDFNANATALRRCDRDRLARIGPAKSQSAGGLADDYAAISNEILEAFTAAEVVIVDTDDPPLVDAAGSEPRVETTW